VNPTKKLGLVWACHALKKKHPTCLPISREDFSFQWQPPSQFGEMVRLGMGHPFKTLPFQFSTIKTIKTIKT
jgi:hypothetical protein